MRITYVFILALFVDFKNKGTEMSKKAELLHKLCSSMLWNPIMQLKEQGGFLYVDMATYSWYIF